MEDRSIIKLFFDRAEGAIEALAKKFGKGLYRIGMNILSDPQDAEECVSDTYLAAWNAIPPAQPDPLSAYIYKMGRNLALKKLRGRTAQKRSAYEVSLDELAECLPDTAMEDALDARALGRCINAFLTTLSDENRNLFLRRYWFGDSVQELSRLFSLPTNTLSVRLSRLRSRLKEHLIKEGFSL